MRFSALAKFLQMLFLAALAIPSYAQDVKGASAKCTEFGFKENTKSHEECVKQFLNSMGSAKTAPVKKPISTPPESASTDDQKEDDYWKEAKSVGNKEAFEAYLKFYPRGRYVGLANARITQLNKLESAKVENDPKPNENPKNRPCSTTITSKDWTNCVGTYSWPDGNKYVGEFKNGNFAGQGTFYHLADNQWKGDKYVGEFRDGKFNGQGTYTFYNENKYVGEFRNNNPNGQGAFYFLANNQSKGDKYVGEFRDGKFNGQGTHFLLAENQWKGDIYVGEYKDGKFNGQGTYYYLADNQWKGYKFVGAFVDGKRNGQGVLFGADGRIKYSGNYSNDKAAP
jgi:hypothetical protein